MPVICSGLNYIRSPKLQKYADTVMGIFLAGSLKSTWAYLPARLWKSISPQNEKPSCGNKPWEVFCRIARCKNTPPANNDRRCEMNWKNIVKITYPRGLQPVVLSAKEGNVIVAQTYRQVFSHFPLVLIHHQRYYLYYNLLKRHLPLE